MPNQEIQFKHPEGKHRSRGGIFPSCKFSLCPLKCDIMKWNEEFRQFALKNIKYNPKKDIHQLSIVSYLLFIGALDKETSITQDDLLQKVPYCKEIILEEYAKGNLR